MTRWQQEQFMLEEQFVKRMLIDYNIREVTTQRQAKNGTREFEFPVPAYTKQRLKWFEDRNKQESLQLTHSRSWFPNSKLKDLPRLRLACFKSGYVRKQNGADRAYQLNPTYKTKKRWVFLTENGLETREYDILARAKIFSNIAKLNFMLKYYLKNYANEKY